MARHQDRQTGAVAVSGVADPFAGIGEAPLQYAMRFTGVDGWVLSRDVVARLMAEGIVDEPATARKAQKAIRVAFDIWRADSGRSLTEISRTLAFTI